MTDFHDFKGSALPLKDTDLPRLGSIIYVGEDELHAFMDAETSGHGFDSQGRPKMLFEPHVFYRLLGAGAARDNAVKLGLAYQKWGTQPYPPDSYPRLVQAMGIDEDKALMSASWGLGQIMGENYKACLYPTVAAMVLDFMNSETKQLGAMVQFLVTNNLADKLKAHDWAAVARGYNGASYAKNGYDKKLATNFAKWQAIKDTLYTPEDTTVTEPLPVEPPVPPMPTIVTSGVTPMAQVQVHSSSITDLVSRAAQAAAGDVLSKIGGLAGGVISTINPASIVADAIGAAFNHPGVQAAAADATTETQAPPDSKPAVTSVTLWGAVATIIGGIAACIHLYMTGDFNVADYWPEAVIIWGGFQAAWGRLHARTTIQNVVTQAPN